MKFNWIVFAACSTTFVVTAADLTVPEWHKPVKVMGKDYWPALYRYEDWAYRDSRCGGWCSDARKVRFDNPEILKIPAFRDAVPVYYGHAAPPADDVFLQTWPRIADLFHPEDPDRELIWTNPHPDRPFMFWATGKRNVLSWAGELKLDYDDYRKWKAAHPNHMYDGGLDEWDNDFNLGYTRVEKIKDGPKKEGVRKFLGERPKNRYERMEKMRRYYENRKACCYGGDMYVLCAHVLSLHFGADCGANYVALETTDTSSTGNSSYRWNIAQMFARGAARQFRTPWEWYIAGYRDGYTQDGKPRSTSVCVYPESEAAIGKTEGSMGRMKWHWGPEHGTSANLLRRAYYYAWVNGPTFTQLEEWSAQLLAWSSTEQKTVLSPRAKDYIAFHDFTQAAGRDRGTPYTPVALCIPVAQFYPIYGGFPACDPVNGYLPGDFAVDAALYTLSVGYDRATEMKRGVEYPLMNSPYAMMYDVIAPDVTRQSDAEKLAMFKSYKALVVMGEYRDRSFEKLLAAYEKEGGRVIRVDERLVPTPAGLADVPTAHRVIEDVRAGRRTFPALQKTFADLQRAYFPFKVEGDCLYGANKTAKGWLVYVFNNKGVIKWCDAPHSIDHKYDAEISIAGTLAHFARATDLVTGQSVPVAGNTLKVRVPAGDFVLLEVCE